MKDMEDDLQKLTDKYVKEVDKAVEAKIKRGYDSIRPVEIKAVYNRRGDKVQMLWKLSPLFLYTYCY